VILGPWHFWQLGIPPKQREQSFWAILYRHMYIYRWWCSFLLRNPGDWLFNVQLPQMGDSPAARFTTLLAFLWALVVMRTVPDLGNTEFSNSPSHSFGPQMTDWISRHPLVNDINDPSIYICIIFESPNEWLQCKTSFFENMCLLLGGRSCLPISLHAQPWHSWHDWQDPSTNWTWATAFLTTSTEFVETCAGFT